MYALIAMTGYLSMVVRLQDHRQPSWSQEMDKATITAKVGPMCCSLIVQALERSKKELVQLDCYMCSQLKKSLFHLCFSSHNITMAGDPLFQSKKYFTFSNKSFFSLWCKSLTFLPYWLMFCCLSCLSKESASYMWVTWDIVVAARE